ncbi:hypothetical protein TWF696_000799 [Orbilia brochopaga]|uniref:UBA domain-containing protein n=1 Tax=Orbilia brochopaga TaxID=3140254 RepID=A0AAV9VCF2_9PEZI
MPSRPSSPLRRPRSPPRPRSPTTSTFQIRGLPSSTPHHEAGSVTISGSEYDRLINEHPDAVLCYIDEDDEEVIRVGSGTELYARWLEVMGFPPPPPPIIFNVEGGSTGLQHWREIFQKSQPEPPKDEEPEKPIPPPRPTATVTAESEEEESLYTAPPKVAAPDAPPKELFVDTSASFPAPRLPVELPVELAQQPIVASFEAEINRIYDEVVSQAGGSPRCLSPRPGSPQLPNLPAIDVTAAPSSQQEANADQPPRSPVDMISDVVTSMIQSIQRVAQEATTQAARAFPPSSTNENEERGRSPAETLDAFNTAVQQLLKSFTDQIHVLATEAVESVSNPRAHPQHPAAVIRTFAETVGHAAVQNAGRLKEELRGVGSDASVEAQRAAEELKKAAEEVRKAAQIVGREVGRRGSAVGRVAGGATREVGRVFSDGAGIVTGFAGGLVRNLSNQSQQSRPEDAPEVVPEEPQAAPPKDAKETAPQEHPVPGSFPVSPQLDILPPPPPPHRVGESAPPPEPVMHFPPPPLHAYPREAFPPPPTPVAPIPACQLPPPGFPAPFPPPPPQHGKQMPPHHGLPPMRFHPPMGFFPAPPPQFPAPPPPFPPPPPQPQYHPPHPLPFPYHPVDMPLEHPREPPPSRDPGWQQSMNSRSGGAWSGFGRSNGRMPQPQVVPVPVPHEPQNQRIMNDGFGLYQAVTEDVESSISSSSSDSEQDYKPRVKPFRQRGSLRSHRSRRRQRSQESGHHSDSSSSGIRSWKGPHNRRSPMKVEDSPFENPWSTGNVGSTFIPAREFKPVPPPKPFRGFPYQFPPPPPQFFPPLPSFPDEPPSPVLPERDNSLPPIASVVPGIAERSDHGLNRRHSSHIPRHTVTVVSDSESEDEWKDTKEKMDNAPEPPEHERVNLVDLESSVSSLASQSTVQEPMKESVPQFHYPGLRRSRTTTEAFGKSQPWLHPWQRRAADDSLDAERSEAMKRFPSISELQNDWNAPMPTPPSNQGPHLPPIANSSPFDDLSSLAAALPPIATVRPTNTGPSNPFTVPPPPAVPAPLPGAWPFPATPVAPLVDTSDVTSTTNATATTVNATEHSRQNSRNPFLAQPIDTSFTPPAAYNFPPLPGNLHRATSMSNASGNRSRQSSTSTVRFAEPLMPRRAQTVLDSSTRHRTASPFMPGRFPDEAGPSQPRPQPQTSQSAIEDAMARERERMRLIEEVEESVRRSSEEFEQQQRINDEAAAAAAAANSRAGPSNGDTITFEDPIDKCVNFLIELGYTEMGTDRLRVFAELSDGQIEEAVELVEEEKRIWQSFSS